MIAMLPDADSADDRRQAKINQQRQSSEERDRRRSPRPAGAVAEGAQGGTLRNPRQARPLRAGAREGGQLRPHYQQPQIKKAVPLNRGSAFYLSFWR